MASLTSPWSGHDSTPEGSVARQPQQQLRGGSAVR